MEMGGGGSGGINSAGSSDSSLHGLKFGKKIYFEDTNANTSNTTSNSSMATTVLASSSSPGSNLRGASASSSASTGKKGKGVAPAAPPRCQVEGCDEDLSGAKAYYCRHKVCAMHSKAPRVIVGGLEQRFCQQCSRFHQLTEFDQGKRSCRRRLAGHNERRRKPPPGPFSSRYGRLAASFHDEPGRFRSFLLDFSYPRVPSSVRDAWPTVRSGGGGDMAGGMQWQGSLDPRQHHHHHHSAVATAYHHPYSSGSGAPLFSAPELLPPSRILTGVAATAAAAADSSCALSLLSTQPWCAATANSPTATSHRAPTMATSSSFDVSLVAPSVMASSYMPASSWGSRSHVPPSHHEVGGLDEVAAGSSHHHGHFSGELELALQGNGPPPPPQIDHGGSGSAFGSSGNAMHWSL